MPHLDPIRPLANGCFPVTPMYPYVAPHIAKIHTLITLGISLRTKPLVFRFRTRRPGGFDSYRPLHFPLSLAIASKLDRQLTTAGTLADVG